MDKLNIQPKIGKRVSTQRIILQVILTRGILTTRITSVDCMSFFTTVVTTTPSNPKNSSRGRCVEEVPA